MSYAASVAKDTLSAEESGRYKKAFKDYAAISVREKSAVELLRPITPVEIQWVVDPVFLLRREEWQSLVGSKCDSERYALCYFFGNDSTERKIAKEYAKCKNLKLKIQKSDVLERLGLEKDKYILLSAHREENIDSEKNFLSLFTAINALAEKYDMPILYSCHPRSKHRLEKSGFELDPRVRVNEPLGFNDYNKLQMNALAIVSDSGTLPEESSFYLSIGHPIAAVCIRTSTERPEALEAGDFILAGITTRELLNATDMAIKMKQKGVLGKPCPDYVDETVSMKVVRIIQGYVNVVNKMVWRKS